MVANRFFGPWKKSPMMFRHAVRFGIISAFVICLVGEAALAQNGIIARKRVLAERLDSLDVEKQLRKRRGEPLEDLEKAADSIKDSIAAIKGRMPVTDMVSETMTDSLRSAAENGRNSPGALPSFQKYLPHSFFDWMVDIVGFIAVVSGIVLIAGIFGLLAKGLRKKKKAPPLPKTLHEIFPRSVAAESYERSPQVPKRGAEEKEEDIASLRRRIERSEPQDEGVLATVDDSGFAEGAPKAYPSANADPAKDPARLKQQIIRAAQSGLDVQEISRRFHMSLDEVSLILRISRQGDRPAR